MHGSTYEARRRQRARSHTRTVPFESAAARLAGRAAAPAAVAAVVMSISRRVNIFRVNIDWLVIRQTPVELAGTDVLRGLEWRRSSTSHSFRFAIARQADAANRHSALQKRYGADSIPDLSARP